MICENTKNIKLNTKIRNSKEALTFLLDFVEAWKKKKDDLDTYAKYISDYSNISGERKRIEKIVHSLALVYRNKIIPDARKKLDQKLKELNIDSFKFFLDQEKFRGSGILKIAEYRGYQRRMQEETRINAVFNLIKSDNYESFGPSGYTATTGQGEDESFGNEFEEYCAVCEKLIDKNNDNSREFTGSIDIACSPACWEAVKNGQKEKKPFHNCLSCKNWIPKSISKCRSCSEKNCHVCKRGNFSSGQKLFKSRQEKKYYCLNCYREKSWKELTRLPNFEKIAKSSQNSIKNWIFFQAFSDDHFKEIKRLVKEFLDYNFHQTVAEESIAEIQAELSKQPNIEVSELETDNQNWEKQIKEADTEEQIYLIKEKVLSDIAIKRKDKGEEIQILEWLARAKQENTYQGLALVIEEINKLRFTKSFKKFESEINKQEKRLSQLDNRRYSENIGNQLDKLLKDNGLEESSLDEEAKKAITKAKSSGKLEDKRDAENSIMKNAAKNNLNNLIIEAKKVLTVGTERDKEELISKIIKFTGENDYQTMAYQEKKSQVDKLLAQLQGLEENNNDNTIGMPASLKAILIIISSIFLIIITISLVVKFNKHLKKKKK